MRQHDVFRNPSTRSARFAPYLVVLQSDLTRTSTTVVVAPLIMRERIPDGSRLFPDFEMEGRELVLAVNELGAIRQAELKDHVGNLGSESHRITVALDLLFTGI